MDGMTIFDQRLEQIQCRLDKAIQANIEKYPECQFDFSNTQEAARSALAKLRDAVADYAENKLTESQVKPAFIAWINAIRMARSVA